MPDELVTLLRSESCRSLLDGLCRRVERGTSFTGTLTLSSLTVAEQRAISDLTGQAFGSRRASIDLAAFDQLIRDTRRFESLLQLVEEAAGGPIENKLATRQQHSAQWKQLWEWAETRAAQTPGRKHCLNELRQTGWLKARSRRDHKAAKQMLRTAFDLLDKLPADGIPLSVFAATHLHDAHALDLNHDLGRLVCRAIAAAHDLPAPKKRSDLRRTWELAGIVPDELSATVLTLNLPVLGESLSDEMLRAHAKLGEPCRLTFRHLRLHAPTIQPPGDAPLFVCENPSIVAAAAERSGSLCQPLICVEGQPNLTAWKLLSMASATGWQLTYHGDFDWGGIRIANQIYRQYGFVPWRYDVPHYTKVTRKQRQLVPPVAEALWDPGLSRAMESDGRALEEEQVLDQLLADLAT